MVESYEYESVMEFMHLLPVNSKTINILATNIPFFKKYHWQDKATLFSFSRVASVLISNHRLIDSLEHNKTFLLLKEIIFEKK